METVTEFLSKLANRGVKLSAEAGRLNCYAPQGTLTGEIRDGIVKFKAEILAFLENGEQRETAQAKNIVPRSTVVVPEVAAGAMPAIPVVDRKTAEALPLSFAQERLWFFDQLEQGSAVYNISRAVTIEGPLDGRQLEEALALLVARHETLRTRFPSHDGQARQVIAGGPGFTVTHIDLSDDDAETRAGKALEICRDEAATPFDLAHGPLFRATVIQVAEPEHLLVLTAHQIVADGASMDILLAGFSAIVHALGEGTKPNLAPLPVQYADYAVWQREWLEESGTLARQLAYWERKLADLPPALELVPDRTRPAVQSYAGAMHGFTLDAHLTGQLERLAAQQGCTLYMVLLAAFDVLLHRYTGEDDFCVGSPVLNRRHPDTKAVVGPFANMLPLRERVSASETFASLLARVKTTCLEAYAHQDVPFEKLVDALQPERNLASSAIFQVTLSLEQRATAAARHDRFREYPLPGSISNFDLSLAFAETPRGLAGTVEYSTAIYEPNTIARLAEHFEALCRAVVANPTAVVAELDFVSEAEMRRLLVEYNATQTAFRDDICVHELFAERAALHPSRVAVACGDEQLTYEQLHRQSDDLALYLQALGVQPDAPVGLCVERSVDTVVGLLAILKAGGAYLPLDADYPDERLAYMLRDTGARIVLTQQRLLNKLAGVATAGTRLVALDTQRAEISMRAEALQAEGAGLQQQVTPAHLAYVIYTSGSTGLSKGVMVEHRSVLNLFAALKNSVYSSIEGGIESGRRVSVNGPIVFDTSVKQLIQLLDGHTLDIVPEDVRRDGEALLRYVRDRKLEVFDCTPSQLRLLLEAGLLREPSALQLVLVGGEPIDETTWATLAASDIRFFNVYGPTECTVDAAVCRISSDHPAQTIGGPVGNTRLYILDANGRPQPLGVPGELHIAGAGVARGYLNRPELTQEKFVADPFTPGGRMYKTGDLARWRNDGTVQYLGRIDTQVKIRGFRVELGEIEVQLAQYDAIQESVVIARGEEPHKQLIAFYRANGDVAAEELRAHLSRTLPEYMIPAAYVRLESIPLNTNGKVDRRALQRLDVAVASGREYVAPRNETEQALAEIWAEVLGLAPEEIGVNDSFFELGGHSLLATRVISKVRARLNAELPLKALFERTTVSRCAELLAAKPQSNVPVLAPVDRSQLDRLPLSFAQERIWFFDQLEPGSVIYNLPNAFTIRGALDVEQLEQAFKLLIARHENLRTVFPVQDGQARQVILDKIDFHLETLDLSDIADEVWSAAATLHQPPLSHSGSVELPPPGPRLAAAAVGKRQLENHRCRTPNSAIFAADATRPFDLAHGPLLRAKVIRTAEQEHILYLNLHHIISDGWSMAVLIRELDTIVDALAAGREPELAPLPIQYADYAVWQRTWLEESGALDEQLTYWQAKLAGAPESLEVATDYARPAVQSFAGARHSFTLDAGLTAQLRRIAQEQGATLYMVLLAAFKTLLHRYTGQTDLCVGTPIANRHFAETEGLIGMFVNTLALRNRVEGEETFATLLSRVKATCLEAYQYQDAPFDRVVDVLHPQRSLAVSPIFQVMFILQNEEEGWSERFSRYPLDSSISKFDLTAAFTERAGALAASLEFSTALYEPGTIERMAAHLVALCRAIVAAPAAELRRLDYLGEDERRQLAAFNEAPAIDECLHQRFVEQAARRANQTAVVCGDTSVTYEQLQARSRQLALYLQAEGVAPDALVALCMERSLDVVVALLGILQAGGAYVPLDPDYPDDRLAYMVQDSKAAIVLTQEALLDKLGAVVPAGTRLIALDREWPEIAARVAALQASGVELQSLVTPEHLAYVMYTSGSTGRPKGVTIEHRQLASYVTAIEQKLQLPEGTAYAFVSTFAADLGNTVLFPALAGGGTLHVLDRETVTDADRYAAYCSRHRIDCMKVTPSHLQALVGDGTAPELIPARTLVLGGEVLSRGVLDLIRRTNPACRIYNHYGPTECSVGVLCGEVTPAAASRHSIPLGTPLGGTRIYILDALGQAVPAGVAGELYIGGPQVARGYLNQPELTAERFVADPFDGRDGARMYRTGDVARWLSDGTVQFFGRNDFQVKIRGFRVELGEIEAQLAKHPRVKEAVVVAREDELGEQRLVAYVTTGAEPVSVDELRAHMQGHVPQYMVPAAFVVLDALPLTPNGKIDRRALPQPDAEAYARTDYEPPQGRIETTLAALWQELLPVARVGRNDDFFELGGHSLLATRLISRIRGGLNVELPLKALFERTTIAGFAELVAGASKNDIPAVAPVDRTRLERLPLSFAQERLWFFDQLEPGSTVYNVPRAITINGPLDLDHVERAFELIVARHEILRTIFPSQEGQAQQVVLDHARLPLDRIDLTALATKADRDQNALNICQAEAATPFDLTTGPLLRVKALKLAADEHMLMLSMHHIISDGWSLGVLIKELGTILEAFRDGREPALAPLPVQYADYAVWQRRWLEAGGILDGQLEYWRGKLTGVPESLDLVADYPRPSVQSFAGATRTFALDAQLTGQLKTLAQQSGGTLYMVLLAAFKVLLHRYTGQSDICVGSPIANRQYGETEALIGMFANTLALRNQVDGPDTFTSFLSRVKTTCLEAYEHQDAPFEKVVDIVRPQRNLAISPIFQVMVILQNADIGTLDERFPRRLLDSVVSKFDLTASFTERPEGLSALIEYSTALYKPETIERMAQHFVALCRAIVATPTARIRDLDYLGAAEKHRLLVDYNATAADYPKDGCLHQLFAAQVAGHAGDTAVVCGDERLTYQQLYERSQDVALYLQAEGVGPDQLVGLCVERSLDMLVGMLGILQAGGAYVPLDPEYPDDRLAYMVQDSRATIVLTQEKLQDQLRALLPAGTRLIALDQQWPQIASRVAALKADGIVLRNDVQPEHLAYVIYTSGSTGQPKGVAIEHHSPVTLVHWATEVYSREELSSVLAATSICFDLSVYEIFVTLANGGTIVLVPNALGLIDLASDTAVTLVNTVPSAMEELVRANAIPASVQTINLAGEPLSQALVARIYSTTHAKKVYDLYGPSEDTTYSTYVLRQPDAPATIGRPISNTSVYILDAYGHLQPVGVPGELHIAGDGLCRGYLHRPELTQEKFIANPFEPGTRMYRTGDLARWLDDGTIQYLGRIDTQVKVRGFRIELGEIEARLAQHPDIQDVAVVAQGQGAGKQLIAFYRATDTTADGVVELPYDELRAHLLTKLPEYMVPAAFVSLAAIPLNPNGKVDRRMLARIDVTIASGKEYVAPRNETEQQLVEIWAEVLKLAPEKIGINDNFFELGGHSLLATQLVAKIRRRLNVELPLKMLFERTTVALLAAFVAPPATSDAGAAAASAQPAAAAEDKRHSALAAQLMAKLRGRLGEDSPLKALFENTSIDQLAELIAEAEETDVEAIPRADRSKYERLPLSFAQERLWFVSELDPDSAVYNVPVAFTIDGALDVRQLEAALNLVIGRHEVLRTLFPSDEGQARQLILDKAGLELQQVDLSGDEDRDAKARELCQTEAALPFNLATGPLLRAKVIRLAEERRILILTMHHITSDGWSLGVLLKELGAVMEAYEQGREPELPALPIQYADYAVWQRTWLENGGVIDQQLSYWQQKLAGVPESLDLFTDHPRPSVQSFAGATHEFTLDAQLSRQLKALAQQQGGTLFMVLLAAFKALLHRYTGQQDICVGSPIANRQHAETEALIGMFANTLALRSQVVAGDSFQSLLDQVRATCLEAYEHQDTPFERIVDMLHPQRNLAITPIFQVMLVLQNVDMGALDARFPRYRLESGISKFDLTASFSETAKGMTGAIEFSTALYKAETIERMAQHFVALCRAVVATPTARIRDLDYLGAAEKRRLLVDYNATAADYPKHECLHQLFAAQVAEHANDVAVVCGDDRLTYRQLYDRSAELAHYLQAEGVGPEQLVGLCMERSADMLIGMLGILQAGGAYVPLDPQYPDDRLAYMVQDSRATIVLTQATLQDQLRAMLPAETRLIALDRQWPEIASRVAALNADGIPLRNEVRPDNLAYVIYTSGSTGQPKGVAIEHHSPVTLVHWASEVYSREELAGVLASTSICFDLSVYEIFVTLANGGTIVLVPNALGLIDLVTEAPVTLVNTVPSAMEELVRSNAIPASVQTINLAGEPLAQALVAKIYSTTSAKKVFDLYGPSEDTTYSTYVLRQPDAPATIGRPISNTSVYILDAYGHLQPIGVPGELYIAGDGLCRGYLHRPELTQEKFIANPFEPGTRMYRTGDLARWLDDGTIQYLGRIDTQVKVRGFRIELGEIEARLTQHPDIQDVAVVAQGSGAGKQLIAFYRAADTSAGNIVELPYEELRAHLLTKLPEYMVPAAFVSLAAIPLNPNGKVDRRALVRMDITIASGQAYVAPRNETEQQLVEIWAEVLKLAPEKVGINDSFFELGGHSLLATRLISKIRGRLNVDVPLKSLFERSTVARFAELIATATASNVPAIRPIDRTAIERLPLSFAQERLWFFDQLEPGSVRYNVSTAVTITGALNVDHLDEAFNLIIARHENLRTVFPSIDGQARQQILERVDFCLERVDLTHLESKEQRDAEARTMCQADGAKPFDLARGPLLRGKVVKLDEQEHILTLNMHHIITDGWSSSILMKELSTIMAALRDGRRPQLAPLPVQYADYSVWQRTWLEQGGVLEQQLGYWKQKLAGVPESLDLVTDYPRPSVQSVAGAAHPFALDADLTAQLKRLAEQRGGTLYMVLLAAFKVLLHRYTGQQDICVGTLIANRQYAETENLIGMFFNTLALRSQVDGEDPFSALVSQVKATCLEAYEHQDTPFEKVVDALRPQRNLSISPIFQVMLVLHNVEGGKLDDHMQPYPLPSGVSQFDLTAAFIEKPEGLAAYFIYGTALFKPETIERMAGHFTALCRAIVATPTARVCDLNFINETEEQQLLVAFNDTATDYPQDRRIHDFFADRVAEHPDRTAATSGDQSLTYRELYDRSQDLALYLQSQGIGPDAIVGLCLERSLEMMVAIFGTVQAGGAYLPVDPAYPDDRLAYMLEDSQAAVVLTQEKFKSKLASLAIHGAKLIALDTEWAEISEQVAALKAEGTRLRQDVGPEDVCYLIYTSGSTGRPKGVLNEHRGLVNRVNWMQKAYQLTGADVVLQKTPYSFDVSVWEFFWPMMAGASVVFAAPEGHKDARYLEGLINEAGITTLHFVPSMLHAFLETAGIGCPGVRQIFCSGEALDRKSVDRYRKAFPNALLHNLYGPTEAAIDVTFYDCSKLPYPFVPIGAPIDNTQIYILDRQLHVQPVGVPGELHIAGDGLARGYHDRPDLTEAKFIANPFSPGRRMYKTGDLARWLDDGNIQYLGRLDTQVKIRGFRIETGEIEAQLNQHPKVRESAVVAQGTEDKQLVAFYRATETQGDQIVHLPYEELRAHLLRTLPEYMVPAAFVSLEAIPLSSNGKVDHGALARMDVRIVSGQEYVAPRNETERQLAAIWAQVLTRDADTIGINDNFFELGGHSLLAVKLIERMRQQGLQTTLQALFTAPTLAKLASAVAQGEEPAEAVADAVPDFERESTLSADIVLRTDSASNGLDNAFLTGASGFLGAFLLSDLLTGTNARVHCLVRAADRESGLKRIEEQMKTYRLWDASFIERIVPVPGDLSWPLLGLTRSRYEELARDVDVIYHNGANVNLYYPYDVLKTTNVRGTEELLRMASFGRSKSLHFVSTLHVTSARGRDANGAMITEADPLPRAELLMDGYAQSKWVAEKLVAGAVERGIPTVIYRPSQIIGHSTTGAASLSDFVPSFIRGCMEVGYVPDVVADQQLYLAPVDYVSRSIVAISRRPELFGRAFNLTNTHATPLREVLDCLLRFDPTLETMPYEKWRATLEAEPDNPLARYLPSFAHRVPEPQQQKAPGRPRFDCSETLKVVESIGISHPQVDEQLLQTYFAYLAEHAASRVSRT
ncbi:MAG TPA: non-ribosomal peptide synthase/polyketide synthase [Thermoanaerobaculia bacterium]